MRTRHFWPLTLSLIALIFSGCTDGQVSVSFGQSTSATPPFLAPTLKLTTGTSPANNNAPILSASGVSNGDQVTIYSDSTCTTKIVSATATSTAVNITIPTLISEGVTTYYAKRVNGTQTSSCTTTPLTYQYLKLDVSPLYPNNGRNWNDYVANDNSGDRFMANDITCSPGIGTHSQCIHGGEKRVVTIINGAVKFISRGLRSNMGVADLLNTAAPAWKPNYVTLYVNGSPTAVGNASTWYQNSVGYLTSGTDLNTPSKVYTINSDTFTTGNIVAASRVTIAIPKGLRLIYNGTSNNCDGSNGASGTTAKCFVGITGAFNFTWIEGSFQGSDGTNTVATGMLVYGNYLTHIRNVFISNVSGNGIALISARAAFISGFRATQLGCGIATISSADYNVIYDATVSNTTNAAKAGISLNTFANNFLVRATLAANNGDGVYINAATGLTVSHVTSDSNGKNGVYLSGGASTASFNQITTANNSTTGLNINSASNTAISNLHSIQNTTTSINDASVSSSKYTGALLVAASSCAASGGAGINNTCSKTGTSTAIRADPVAPSFFGYPSKDGFNPNSNTTAFSSISTLLGWSYFENLYRVWTSNNTSWPFTTTGACTAGNCTWWDFSLASNDTSVRSKFGTFAAGSACPTSVGTGADYNTLNYGNGGSTSFLGNALEAMGSRYGNDDGICDAKEECIFTTNLGAYQGTYNPNATSQTCTYSNSTVPNVTLYNAYEFVYFDSANSSSNVALTAPGQPPTFSFSNLTIYNASGTMGAAIGNLSFAKSTGKHYFEAYINSLTGTAAGLSVV